MVMGMRVIRPDLELWQLDLDGVRSRMYLAPTPRERDRWHALWLLCRGRPPRPLPRHWAGMFNQRQMEPPSPREVRRLIFEQTGGSPPSSARNSRRS